MALNAFWKTVAFIHSVYKKMRDNGLFDMANALSFKLILSIFPFIIFLMSCFAYLNLDLRSITMVLAGDVPTMVKSLVTVFVEEVVQTKRLTLLSSSLAITLFSASSGVYTLMKGLNRAYGSTEVRGYFVQRFISLVLVIIMTVLIIVSLYVCIFSDKINHIIFSINGDMPMLMVNARSYIITVALIFVMITLVYMLALVDRPRIRELIPGTIFTMVGWLLVSKGFNIYVNNFSRYSTLYGSIGAIFIFALWINLISYCLLIGGQINATLRDIRRNKEDFL